MKSCRYVFLTKAANRCRSDHRVAFRTDKILSFCHQISISILKLEFLIFYLRKSTTFHRQQWLNICIENMKKTTLPPDKTSPGALMGIPGFFSSHLPSTNVLTFAEGIMSTSVVYLNENRYFFSIAALMGNSTIFQVFTFRNLSGSNPSIFT